MDGRSKHLSHEERGVILAEHGRGSSQRSIGGLLGWPASTIGRELSRGRQDDGSCCPHAGRPVYEVRRARCRPARKLIEGSATHRFAHDHLVHRRWSPAQIAQRLRLMNLDGPDDPDDPAARVSHETIHAAIYAQPRGGLKTAMIEALRQDKSKCRRSRTTLAGGSGAPDSLRIIHRPEEPRPEEPRPEEVWPALLGHGEGDPTKGAFDRSAVGTVVERKTRFVILSSSSVKQSIRGIDCSAERAAAPPTRRWRGFHAR